MNADVVDLTRSYSENGYVVLREAFSEKALGAVGQALLCTLAQNNDALAPRGGLQPPLNDAISITDARNHGSVYAAAQSVGTSAAAYQLMGQPEFLNLLLAITGFTLPELHLMPMYLIIQMPSDDRFDYTWHQDSSYYAWCKELLTLWFPINRETNRETGTISVIPGSHRKGPRSSEEYLRHGFFRQMESKMDEHELEQERILDLALGDCCIMEGNLVHRSVANRSNSPRVAGLVRMANNASQPVYERDRYYCVHKS
jgi:hypothetical protein